MFNLVKRAVSEPWKSLAILFLICISANSTVFFLGRTLIPLAPANSFLYKAPYGYQGPVAESPITLDEWGSFNGSFCCDAYSVSSLKQGHIPFWNPYQGLGQPFLANGLSAVLYPLNWLELIIPPAWWDMVWLLNWFLAAFFFYKYLRLLEIEPIVALVGGTAVLSTGFFQIYLALREVVAVAAWWPLLLYGVERTVQNPSWPHRQWVLALAVYCSITAGQPESTFVSLFVILLYAVIRLMLTRWQRGKIFLALIPGTLGGFLLAAPMWLNFVAYAFPAYSRHLAGSKVGLEHYLYNATSGFLFPGLYGTIYSHPFGKFTGWKWGWSPGWAPAMLIFLAFVSLGSLRRHRGQGQLFFTILTVLTLAKFCGMPGINSLGNLPVFERIYFVRYAAFLVTFGLVGMAVYGLSYLARLEPRQWQNWLVGWGFFCLGVLIMGVYPICGHLQGLWSIAILATFGGLGLAWTILGPLVLFWLRRSRPDEHNLFYVVAALGIFWQGIAYAPDGFSISIKCFISFLFLVIFLLTVILISRPHVFISFKKMAIYGLIIAALPKIIIALFSSQGLPKRYDPLTTPPYLSQLLKVQDKGTFRTYSFDSAPAPNFSAPFGLSNLGVLDPLVPKGNALFIHRYIDRGTLPLLLGGNTLRLSIDHYGPEEELNKNLRYYSLVSTKFILGQFSEPLCYPFYDTEALHNSRSATLLTHPLEFHMVCPAEVLSRVDILLDTVKSGAAGSVNLRIFSSDGSLIGIASLPSRQLKGWQKFIFPPITGLKDKEICLQLNSHAPDGMAPQVVAWVFPKAPELGFACRLFSAARTPEAFPLIYEDPHTKVRIWENPGATPRLFLAPEEGIARSWEDALDRLKNAPDLTHQVWLVEGPVRASTWPRDLATGKILSFQIDPNDIRATFEAYTPGILTLTDSFSPGWHAFLNGRKVPVLLVDGVFRGVRLDRPGIYKLHYFYRPPYWYLSVALATFGFLLVIVGMTLTCPPKTNPPVKLERWIEGR
jgi:hypothetical protein